MLGTDLYCPQMIIVGNEHLHTRIRESNGGSAGPCNKSIAPFRSCHHKPPSVAGWDHLQRCNTLACQLTEPATVINAPQTDYRGG